MNINYYLKYLKYKTKYLNLYKLQQYGGTNVDFIINEQNNISYKNDDGTLIKCSNAVKDYLLSINTHHITTYPTTLTFDIQNLRNIVLDNDTLKMSSEEHINSTDIFKRLPSIRINTLTNLSLDIESLYDGDNFKFMFYRYTYFEKYIDNYILYNDINKIYEIALLINQEKRTTLSGLYFINDFLQLYQIPDKYFKFFDGYININYWYKKSNYENRNLCKINDFIKPSNALNAFYFGPSICDCAVFIQSCIYKYILNRMGEDLFNKMFGNFFSQFTISPYIFEELKTHYKDKYEHDKLSIGDKIKVMIGNKLYFLFDSIPHKSQLQNNDIVYIKGVPDYEKKHFVGNRIGENLIYNNGEFIGFGSEFTKPQDYNAIKKILITGYNNPPSKQSNTVMQNRIELYKKMIDTYDPISTIKIEIIIKEFTDNPNEKNSAQFKNMRQMKYSDITIGNIIDYYNEALDAAKLAADQKTMDSDIIGIQYILRFNEDKFKMFIDFINQSAWYELPESQVSENTICSCGNRKTTKCIKCNNYYCKTDISHACQSSLVYLSSNKENNKSTFETFIIKTDFQKYIYGCMRKFATKIFNKNKDEPLCIIMTGTPGIGKTHLTISTAKFVSSYGKKVLFIGEYDIRLTYDTIKHTIINYDLICYDDVNNQYDVKSQEFISLLLKNMIMNGKSLILTSNMPISNIYDLMDRYLPYNYPYVKNCLVINNINSISFRSPNLIIPKELKPTDKINLLKANMDKLVSFGIVCETKQPDVILLLCKDILNTYKIYLITLDCKIDYKNIIINNDIIIYTDSGDISIFYYFLELIFDYGKKVIIITQNKLKFKQDILQQINFRKETTEKITSRIKVILPEIFE